MIRFVAMAALLLLAACQQRPLTPAESAALAPRDARLAELYAGSCKACHTVPETRAPLAGDRTQWDPRWAKGEDVLLGEVQVGFGSMPAGGLCQGCSDQDLAALIRFMAGRE